MWYPFHRAAYWRRQYIEHLESDGKAIAKLKDGRRIHENDAYRTVRYRPFTCDPTRQHKGSEALDKVNALLEHLGLDAQVVLGKPATKESVRIVTKPKKAKK